MKRLISCLIPSLSCLFLVLLAACAPTATVATQDDDALRFVVVSGNLVVAGNGPIEYGDVRVAGDALVIASPFCALKSCAPSKLGFIRLTYPDEENRSYGPRLKIDVVSGTPKLGRALMTLAGEDKSRPALLQTP